MFVDSRSRVCEKLIILGVPLLATCHKRLDLYFIWMVNIVDYYHYCCHPFFHLFIFSLQIHSFILLPFHPAINLSFHKFFRCFNSALIHLFFHAVLHPFLVFFIHDFTLSFFIRSFDRSSVHPFMLSFFFLSFFYSFIRLFF